LGRQILRKRGGKTEIISGAGKSKLKKGVERVVGESPKKIQSMREGGSHVKRRRRGTRVGEKVSSV